MRVRRFALAAATAALVAGLIGAPAGAEVEGVSIGDVTLTGSVVTVTGAASFNPVTTPQDIGGSKTTGPVGGSPAGDAAGLNIQKAEIQPLANGSGLRFILTVAELPPQVPPEGVRYNWAFQIGQRLYQLQAKRTNIVNVTTLEDPIGHVQHVQSGRDFFQLRGACVTEYLGTPVQGCYHLAFLNGSFDHTNHRVIMDMPFETTDSIGRLVAPDFKPGAALEDNGGNGTAGMVIAASFQAAVSNTQVSQYLNSVSTYHIGPQVHVALGTATASPQSAVYSATATLDADGSFSGTVNRTSANQVRVFVRACNGVTCQYDSAPLP